MPQQIAPIAVRPSTLTGISEWMIVSHYENNYGNAVRTLNAVRRELAALDASAPPYHLRGLKSEELSLMGSVALHERYFGYLGGFRRAGPNSGLGRPDWHEVPDELAAEIATDFGSASAWRASPSEWRRRPSSSVASTRASSAAASQRGTPRAARALRPTAG